MDLFDLKRQFLEHCEIEKGQSVLTIENYDRYISRFLEWQKEQKEKETQKNQTESESQQKITLFPDDLTEESIRQYRLHINRLKNQDGSELKATTQNHHILALRAFLRYLALCGIRTISPEKITLAKTGDREVTFLSPEEYERLFKSASLDIENGYRDEALLRLLFSTGIRVSEAVNLSIGALNFKNGEISILGKGKKLRVVFLSEDALNSLIKYLETRGKIKKIKKENIEEIIIPEEFKNDPVFISNRLNRLNSRAIERIVEKYRGLAGITKKVSPHSLRHTFATDLLSSGADIRSVQSLLGHRNIGTTQIYTHVTDTHLREIHHRFHNKQNQPKTPDQNPVKEETESKNPPLGDEI